MDCEVVPMKSRKPSDDDVCIEWRDEYGRYHEEYVPKDEVEEFLDGLCASGFCGKLWVDGWLNWVEL